MDSRIEELGEHAEAALHVLQHMLSNNGPLGNLEKTARAVTADAEHCSGTQAAYARAAMVAIDRAGGAMRALQSLVDIL